MEPPPPRLPIDIASSSPELGRISDDFAHLGDMRLFCGERCKRMQELVLSQNAAIVTERRGRERAERGALDQSRYIDQLKADLARSAARERGLIANIEKLEAELSRANATMDATIGRICEEAYDYGYKDATGGAPSKSALVRTSKKRKVVA